MNIGGAGMPVVRTLRRAPYDEALADMRTFTAARQSDTRDEIWLVEHPPVFTQGLAGRDEHLLNPGDIAVHRTERGGQVTYHGPGQILLYLLLDLHRWRLGPRAFVTLIEQSLIDLLAEYGVGAVRKSGAPGVYVAARDGRAGAKIAALGIKISRGFSYHGAALNVAMDLEPFSRINPCGYAGLEVTDLERELRANGRQAPALADVAQRLADRFSGLLLAHAARSLKEAPAS